MFVTMKKDRGNFRIYDTDPVLGDKHLATIPIDSGIGVFLEEKMPSMRPEEVMAVLYGYLHAMTFGVIRFTSNGLAEMLDPQMMATARDILATMPVEKEGGDL